MLEKALLDEALHAILKNAIASADTDFALHIGYEARFEQMPLAEGARQRGRASVHFIGQGQTEPVKPAVKRLRETLLPHDADAGVENAGSNFIFWLDLPAVRKG
jgi:hypothetical protein